MTDGARDNGASVLLPLTRTVQSLLGADVVLAFAWRDDRTAVVRACWPDAPPGDGRSAAWPAAMMLPRATIVAAGGIHDEHDVPRRFVSTALRAVLPAAPSAALVVAATALTDDLPHGGLLAIWYTTAPEPASRADTVARVAAIRPALAHAFAQDAALAASAGLAVRFEAVMAASAQGVVFVDAAAGGLVNDAAGRLLGLPAGPADPAVIAERMAALRTRAANGAALHAAAHRLVTEPEARLEHWHWAFDGPHPRHLRVSSVPVRDGASHAVHGRLWTFDDVTREHEVQRAAQTSEARFRAAMGASPDACFLLEAVRGPDGVVTDFVFVEVNARGGALFGMPAEDFVGERLCELFPSARDNGLFARYVAVADTGTLYEVEHRILDPRSTAAWVGLQVVPLGGAHGAVAGVAITARDITVRKRSEGHARLLHDVTRVLAAAPDGAGALGAALAAMCTATSVPYGEAWVPSASEQTDPDASTWEHLASGALVRGPVWHAPEDRRLRAFADASAPLLVAPGTDLPGRAAATGAPVWIADVTAPAADFERAAAARQAGIRGGFAVPVLADGRLVAVLAFHSRLTEDFGAPELDLLATVGAQVGAVVRQKLAEAALREREAELRLTQAAGGLRGWTLELATDRLRFASGTHPVVRARDVNAGPEAGPDAGAAPSPARIDMRPTPGAGATARALIHTDDQERVDADLTAALADPGGRYASTFRVPGPDATVRWVRATGQIERDRDGTPRRLRAVSLDVTAEVELLRRAEASDAELRAVFAAMHDSVLVLDGDGTYLRAMKTALARPDRSQDALVGRRVHEVLPAAVADRVVAAVRRVLATGAVQHLDYALDAPGGPQWLAATGSPLGPNAVLWVARDVTARRAAEAAVRQSEARYRSVLENLSAFAVQIDREGRITFVNDVLLAATGWTREEVLGADYFDRFVPGDQKIGAVFAATVGAGRVHGLPAHHEHEVLTRDGGRRLVAWDNAVLRDVDGRPAGVASVGRDVTEERHLAAERERLVRALEDLAEQDELTGLLNRRGFLRMATQERKSAARTGRLDGVCYVDLDRFKPINDIYGHAAGDAALRAVGSVLRDTARGADFCARFGGDEFAVYALGVTSTGGTHVLAERLRAGLAAHNRAATAAGRPYELAFTIGVAEFAAGEDIEQAMARADEALYAAKPRRLTRASS